MKRFSLFALALLVLLLTLPTLAQDATAEPSPVATLEATSEGASPVDVDMAEGSGNVTINTGTATPTTPPDTSNSVPVAVVIAITVVFGFLTLLLVYHQHQVIKLVSPLVPPEQFTKIIEAVVPKMYETFVMNGLAKFIPTTIDDDGFAEAARLRGLTVTKDEMGVYRVTRTPLPAGGIPVSTSSPDAPPAIS